MEDLAHDLSYALEESSTQQIDVDDQNSVILTPKQCRRLSRKQRGKKRRSDCTLMWDYGNISEASESSLDEALKDYMENVTAQHNSDSEDYIVKRLATFNMSLTNVICGESDSVTENLNSVPPRRRRRRTKKISMDTSSTSCATVISRSSSLPELGRQKQISKTGRKERKISVDDSTAESEHSRYHKEVKKSSDYKSKVKSKRKGGRVDEMEVCKVENEEEDTLEEENLYDNEMDCSDEDTPIARGSDSDTSSLSTSTDEADLFTNDEGREGDDEQSDFYHEPGTVYGVPGIIPWWERQRKPVEESFEKDPRFESILNGVFPLMTKSAQSGFQARLCRLHGVEDSTIRKRRRRLKEKRASGTMLAAANERITQFMIDPQQNELWMHPMKRHQRDQLGHLASLYALDMKSEDSRRKCRPVLLKNRNSRIADERDLNAYMTRASTVNRGIGRGHPYAHHHSMEAKRRRKMAPPLGVGATAAAAATNTGFVGEYASPIPESNIGNRMLQNMGWTPGTGLGLDSEGIQEPVRAYLRPKGRGLGHADA